MKFTTKFKLYVENNNVKLSIKVNSSFVNTYIFSTKQFEDIIDNWRTGIEFRTGNGSWMFQHKKRGPRPVCEPANYVRIDFWRDEQSFHYRAAYDEMIKLEKDYYYQKANNVQI